MAETFLRNWMTSSPKHRVNKEESLVISDSDEDSVEKESEYGSLIDESVSTRYASGANSTSTNNSLNKTDCSLNKSEDSPIAPLNKAAVKNYIKKYRLIDTDDDSINNRSEYENHKSTKEHQNTLSSTSDFAETYDPDFPLTSYSPVLNKGQKRKDVTHDISREDIKELRPNSTNTSLSDMDVNVNSLPKEKNGDDKMSNMKNTDVPVTIVLDSDSASESSDKSDSEPSFVRQEIDVKNIDPIEVSVLSIKNTEDAICQLKKLSDELATTKFLLREGNIDMLPDKGNKLRESALEQEKEIERLKYEWKIALPTSSFGSKESENKKKPSYQAFKESILAANKKSFAMKTESSFSDDDKYTTSDDDKYGVSDGENAKSSNSYLDYDDIPMRPTTSPELGALGKKAQETRDREIALTFERLQDLHGSLQACPSETMKAEDPRGLQVQLFPYQRHALAWLLWREQQKPSGGVLADDMGLGKTLTMISLVLTTLAKKNLSDEYDDDDDDDKWSNSRSFYPKGGTLIVCPASLVKQWENEVRNKCKRGVLSVYMHHGTNRMNAPRTLANNDIVITTYNILSREYKFNSTLFKINWTRVILDEAHYIRNHKSQMAVAACGLKACKRWALSGTPVQNKTMDLYSILKFLQCSPFDDLSVWKRWVDNKNAAGQTRLAAIMKTLMLRRTKVELMAKGVIDSLPEKSIKEVMVQLDPQETLVYEKILVYSRTLFAQFLHQRAEKAHMMNLDSGVYERSSFLSNPYKDTPFTEAQNKLLAMHADVKTHEILVLLLRLRQVCCHPALIHAMLDQDDVKQSGISGIDTGSVDYDLLSRVNRMSINGLNRSFEQSFDENEDEDIGIDKRIIGNVLTHDNPVFDDDRISSKMRALLNLVRDILQNGDDKLIIVSQWTMLLDIIASHLSSIKGATFDKFTGAVAIKHRQDIMDAFNQRHSGPRILLLSLTAGGVGLNLMGANHLLLFDIHWNPQLETQAQDRIYRFGQTKNVYIYKFICGNTIEERIKALQEHKLEIAKNVLSDERGTKSESASKLTLNDLKSLFAL